MDLTYQFRGLLDSAVKTNKTNIENPRQNQNHQNNKNNPQNDHDPRQKSKFAQTVLYLAHQLQSLSEELFLIRPLYTTPPSGTHSKQPPELPLWKLKDSNNNPQHNPPTLISLILSASKSNLLVSLPPQWVNLLDEYIKTSLKTISTTLLTLRTTLTENQIILNNIYKNNEKSLQNAKNSSKSHPTTNTSLISPSGHIGFNLTTNRTPLETFISELKIENNKRYPKMTSEQYSVFEEDYIELEQLSYQHIEHCGMVLLSLESLIMEIGKFIISIETERKQNIALQEKLKLSKLSDLQLNHLPDGGKAGGGSDLSYSILGGAAKKTSQGSAKGVGNSHFSNAEYSSPNHGSDDEGFKNDDFDELSYGTQSRRRNSKTRQNKGNIDEIKDDKFSSSNKNPFSIRTMGNGDGDGDRDHDDDDNEQPLQQRNKKHSKKHSKYNPAQYDEDQAATNTQNDDNNPLSRLYGLTTTQLDLEQTELKNSIDQEEYKLASKVEQSLEEISMLISTFETHISTQSNTIDTIFSEITLAHEHIEYGNDQLEEALARSGWGAKFYMYIFLCAALILFCFDWLLN
jgi:hypothetical protein